MTAGIVFGVLLMGAYVVAVIEAWARSGRLELRGPWFAAVALLGRESVVPRKSDRLFFEAAPALLLMAPVLAVAVLPLSPGLVIADLATGALFVNAVLAYVLVALVMAGWGPDGAYAMVGGWRFLGQLIGYSMLIVMPITGVAMRSGSLVTTAIVNTQAQVWNIIYQPLGFVLFFIAAMALAYLPPFDLPVSGTELAGGIEAEYAGWRLAVMRLARLVLVVTVALATTVFYLGGWRGPGLCPAMWSALKTLSVAATMLWLGVRLPRVREAHFLAWCWKLGIPLALLNLFVVGVLVLVLP